MKKSISLSLVSTMLLGIGLTAVGCDDSDSIKIGLICLHDDSSSYDANFINSMYDAVAKMGLSKKSVKLVTGVPEDQQCYDEASKLAQSCDVVFADSFSHEKFLIQAARENPNVNFCHATGTLAHTENLPNFSNAFASIYEGRYLAGIVAGQKLNEMINDGKFTADQAKIGYVGAYSYAEVISGFTSFYLGAKSVCPSVTMDVKFTGTWYDYDLEAEAATALIQGGCKLISGHADSYGAPKVCETNGVPNISYNISTADKCPNTYLVSSKIDWSPYFQYMIKQTMDGNKIDTDWVGTLANGAVVLTEFGSGVSQTAKDLVATAKQQLLNKELKVFDTSKFTVGGAVLTTKLADVNTDDAFTPDTEAVADGYFHESEYRSAPYFDVQIDGITWLNSKF